MVIATSFGVPLLWQAQAHKVFLDLITWDRHLEVIRSLARVQERHPSVSTFISMMSAYKALLKWITASGDKCTKI